MDIITLVAGTTRVSVVPAGGRWSARSRWRGARSSSWTTRRSQTRTRTCVEGSLFCFLSRGASSTTSSSLHIRPSKQVVTGWVRIALAVINTGAVRLPLAPGWHPCFASRAAVTHIEPLSVTLSVSPSMRHLLVWTLPGRDFVCVEPFFGPANTINTPGRALVPPRGRLELWMQILAR